MRRVGSAWFSALATRAVHPPHVLIVGVGARVGADGADSEYGRSYTWSAITGVV
jgi:hypothetical protein